MVLRWSRRLALATVAAAVCLVPFLGGLAHGHAHQDAHHDESVGDHAAVLTSGTALAAHHGSEDHLHLPELDGTVPRTGLDVVVLPALAQWQLAGDVAVALPEPSGPDEPRPRRTHDPPGAPRPPPHI